MIVWRSGTPPHVGWWNASMNRDLDAWRWWDGKGWSVVSYESNSAERAGMKADVQLHDKAEIEWNDRYPANARVPRIDPRKFYNKETSK